MVYIKQIWHPRGEVFPGAHHTGISYLFYYTKKNIKQKGKKLQTEILDKILVVCLVDLVSPVGDSANFVGVCGC